ncbi:ABC transporter permease [Olivibacter ginsenosidimutans]|uniref:ABC transporter permease n=2 Tax=Olivibacter ginsenosidimutans TaxID=1176537 RepID=A0ABP9C161_9SPHI
MLWVWDELSFDRMHRNGDRIYMVGSSFDADLNTIWPVAPPPIALFGKAEIPTIADACRVNHNVDGSLLVEYHAKKFNEAPSYVDPSFFSMLDFPLITGNTKQPFPDNHSVILGETLAKKYFGKDNAIGQIIQIGPEKENYTVSGIIHDIPKNSSFEGALFFPFEALNPKNKGGDDLNTQWGAFSYTTLLFLKKGADPKVTGEQLANLHRKNQPADIFEHLQYILQPLPKVHLYDFKGNEQGMQQVKIFILVGFVILLIACINYVNLVTARSSRRSREVSVRKIVGANRMHLFWQFISESTLVFVLSLVAAIGLIYLVVPLYNQLSGKELAFNLLDAKVWQLFVGTFLLVILMAGIYPALVLSTFKPALALKGVLPGLGKKSTFRQVLVIVQFTCSVVLIICTVVISRQLTYIRHKNLGYDKENVFILNQRNFKPHYEMIRDELQRQAGIHGVTASSSNITNVGSGTGDIEWEGKPASMANFMINQMSIDRNFLDVLGLKLIQGKGFTGTPADSGYVFLNETAVKAMHLTHPIGQKITFHNIPNMTIAGVVKDFYFKDMKTAIAPCILYMDASGWGGLYVKTTGKDTDKALAAVQRLWKQYNPDYNFEYEFLDDAFDKLYKADIRSGKLFNLFSGVAILLSCLGLFGLVTYTAETKVKEIGIRKTLGASVQHIIVLISKDFLMLVIIALIVAFPLAWWMMSKWLDNYVYRTDLSWWIFVVAGLAAFIIATITVCSKALKAAQVNPIKSLRSE